MINNVLLSKLRCISNYLRTEINPCLSLSLSINHNKLHSLPVFDSIFTTYQNDFLISLHDIWVLSNILYKCLENPISNKEKTKHNLIILFGNHI